MTPRELQAAFKDRLAAARKGSWAHVSKLVHTITDPETGLVRNVTFRGDGFTFRHPGGRAEHRRLALLARRRRQGRA